MDIHSVIKDFKADVEKIYGQRLKKIILYGSYARNEDTPNSDIDLAIVLGGNIMPGKEIDRLIDIITDINLKYGVLVSVYPVSEKDYTSVRSPLLLNLHKEGIVS